MQVRKSGLTVSMLQVSAILSGLSAAFVDADAVLGHVGLNRGDLLKPEKRVPREIILTLWQAALEVTGDPAFGLHLAERIRPGSLDVLDYLVRSSANLGEALARAGRYARLVDDAAEIGVETEGECVAVVPRLARELPIPTGVMECLLAVILRVAREASGTPYLLPIAVELTHAAPRDLSEHSRVFGIQVRFGAARNAITFTAAQVALPFVSADRALSSILDRHAQEQLDRLPTAETFSQHVRGYLAQELRGGDPSVDHIASRLHMSARTLRRRLEEEKTSVQRLLDELRHELALRYFEEQKLSFAEVSFELGFADVRAFRRAFKRWTGRTPSDVLASRKAPPDA